MGQNLHPLASMRIISACYDGMFVVSFEMASFYESIRDRLWSAAFLVTLWDLMLLMVVDMWIRMATHDNFFFHSAYLVPF